MNPLFGKICSGILIILLITKELVSASENKKLKTLSRRLWVPIIPLLAIFVAIVIVKVVEILKK